MRMILQGPPGSGKGTQASLLCQRLGMTHIGTGDILREAVRLGTPCGRLAKQHMDRGQYVPDALVNDIVAERFRRDDRPTSFLVEGYPRTLNQAEAFDQVLRDLRVDLEAVLVLRVPDDEIVHRVSGRRICPRDQSLYHLLHKPPRAPNQCDLCGGPLELRPDDHEETVRARLRLFHATVNGVLDFYRRFNLLHEVNGIGSIQEVFAACLRPLNSESPSC